MKDFLIIQSITNNLFDKITFLKDNNIKKAIKQTFTLRLLLGLRPLNIDMIRKIFFLILLVKNCKIFFDIANFAINSYPPPNNQDDSAIVRYYQKDFFPQVSAKYTELKKSILIQ
jgi:hypothetical protein